MRANKRADERMVHHHRPDFKMFRLTAPRQLRLFLSSFSFAHECEVLPLIGSLQFNEPLLHEEARINIAVGGCEGGSLIKVTSGALVQTLKADRIGS